MVNQANNSRIGLRLLSGLLLALAGLGLPSRQSPSVLAAPQAAGTFTVTSPLDTNANDAVLTLREALLVAKGGTGVAGLGRAASAGEQADLSGCTFSGGLITAGCGPGIANSIVFIGSLGLHPVIALTSSLPSITNTAPTTIDGSVHGVFPIISASGLLTGTDALLITSNNNALTGVTITGAPHDDLRLTGDSNQVLTGTTLLAAGRYGLLLDGGHLNLIESALVGSNSALVGVCSQGNQQGGIVLTNAATTNTVQLSTVACNNDFGVRVDGAGTTFDTIIRSTVSAQSGNGIEIVNGASVSTVYSNTITSNTHDGILISGAATYSNTINGNFIGLSASGVAAGNGQYGLRLSAGAYGNLVGMACNDCTTPTQFISGNALGGVRLETGAISNTLDANIIGLNPTSTVAVPNGGPGVDVNNAPNSDIGGMMNAWFLGSNLIADNLGPGVRFTNTDRGQVGFWNNIAGNAGPGVELINTTNTAVVPFGVCCNAGAGIAIEGASSTGNLAAPYSDSQNGGLPIDLGNDGHTPNDGDVDIGPNNLLEYPVITAASGSQITGTACSNCKVLIYVASGNPAAPGGGATSLQTAAADGLGHWSASLTGGHTLGDVSLQACRTPCIADTANPSHTDSSELSPRIQMWLPAVRR